MTRRVYAPGSDNVTSANPTPEYAPSRGAGGQFARFIKGSTPKYALNRGLREEQHRNTMARMFVRVNQSEYALFRQSIGDDNAKKLVDRLAGDPTAPASRGQGWNDTGYMDFLLRNVQHSYREKVQAVEGLSDNAVSYYFGQTSPVWTYQGAFINTVQDDQTSNFVRLYLNVLRGTQLARRQKVITLRYDSFAVSGTIESLDWSLSAENETICPFVFSFRVKRLYIVNYTAGWTPTRPNGPIADIHALAFDGRPREQSSVFQMRAQVPPDAVSGPTPESPAAIDEEPLASITDATTPSFSVNTDTNIRQTRPVLASGI